MDEEKYLSCLRCGGEMERLKREYIQLGKTGCFFGNWNNLIASALYVDILCCSECGRLEFFTVRQDQEDDDYEEGHIAKINCPNCGRQHDMDDPKCPFCGAKNPMIL